MESDDFFVHCVNHQRHGGDDQGEMRISPMGELTFFSITDVDGAAASVILSRDAARNIVDYLTPLLGGTVIKNPILIIAEEIG